MVPAASLGVPFGVSAATAKAPAGLRIGEVAKRSGLPVKAILAARRVGVCSCDSLRRLIQEKRDEIQGRLTGLEALRQELSTLLQGWEDCGRPKAAQS